ncbi:MAG: S41 family peptidase [Muribaculaceae bacterium]|nr:S41 family peptidase [Muribaculaceae bacterium]
MLIMLMIAMLGSCSENSIEREFVKAAVDTMDAYGLFATGAEWEKAKSEALASNPETFDESQIIVRKALQVAGGKHSRLVVNSQSETTEVVNSKSGTTASVPMPTVTLRNDGILVVKLPAFNLTGQKAIEYAQTVLDAIPADLHGVVIDLRGNAGGNMYPMLAAVHRFIPGEVVFAFKSRNRFYYVPVYGVTNNVNIPRMDYIDCPVAILMDSYTASSGEMVVLAFWGLDNVRTFGTNSAGYTTGNSTYELPQNSRLILTTSSVVTRNGKEFCNNCIEPNVRTSQPLEDALEWLKQQ